MNLLLIFELGLISGLATTLGALMLILFGKPKERLFSFLLGFAGGIMVGVIVLDLLPSALRENNLFSVLQGCFLGLCLMLLLDLLLSQIYSSTQQNRAQELKRMGHFIAIGIALHDLPEGMAIAVGCSSANKLGILIALAIGLHNIPEGMAIAAPLWMSGTRKRTIIIITLLISLITPVGSLIGYSLVRLSENFIAILLALAAGAMSYIVCHELIPESQKKHAFLGKYGIICGFLFLLLLNLLN